MSDKKKLSRAMIEFYEKLYSWENAAARISGLTPQQHHTIEITGEFESARMKTLAFRLGVTMGTLTVMVDRLEKQGYMRRRKDPDDGRGVMIELTEKGRAVYHEHHHEHLTLVETVTRFFTEKETTAFLDMLRKINRSF